MKHAEYLSYHYSFYNTIILQLGLRCPLRCKHCSVFAGPRRPEIMTPALVQRIISDFASHTSDGLVVLTGGEPFALDDLLNVALKEIHNHQHLQSLVITAAPWATSASAAQERLLALPPISLMTVSADAYHEEFVPLSNVAHAVTAAHALGRDVVVTIGVSGADDSYVDRVRDSISSSVWEGIEVDVTQVMPTGRARAAGIGRFATTPAALPEGACDLLGTPVVVHNGNVVACCQIDATNDAQRSSRSEFVIGNAATDSYADLRSRVERDVLFQALRVWGPAELVRLLAADGVSIPLKSHYDGICFLCRDLLGNPDAVAALRSRLSRAPIREQVRLSRMLQYGELRPCPATTGVDS